MVLAIIGFYILCAICIAFVLFVTNIHTKFRDEDGDLLNTIGYEEDGAGRLLKDEREELNKGETHSISGGGSHGGLI